MNRLFAETYAKDQEIEARYDAAELKNDQAAMEQARADHFALETDIQAQGKPFERLHSLYAAAMKVGNEHIDISELHEYQDAAALIASFREYGVEAFTFSSGWSSAVESARISGCAIVPRRSTLGSSAPKLAVFSSSGVMNCMLSVPVLNLSDRT